MIKFKNIYSIILIAILSVISIVTFSNFSENANEVKINWVSFEEAQKLNANKPKKIFIDTYTDWCGWCKKMDANTFSNKEIANYINEHYYAVKLNAESDVQTLYKGQKMTERELSSKIFKVKSFPTTVYLDEKVELLQPVEGYMDVAQLDKILHFFAENFYKNTEWTTFETNYKKK